MGTNNEPATTHGPAHRPGPSGWVRKGADPALQMLAVATATAALCALAEPPCRPNAHPIQGPTGSQGSLIATSDHTGGLAARYAEWPLRQAAAIHMNGRVFDAHTGRFLQTDPLVQFADELQSYNRYAYCFGNPLNCTDPSGYFSFKQFLRMAVAIVATIYLGPGGAAWANGGIFAASTTVGTMVGGNIMAQAAIAGFVSGAISTGSLKGALQGAFSGAVFAGVGNYLSGVDTFGATAKDVAAANALGLGSGGLTGIALHGVAGCVTTVAGGGKCGPGALSAAFSKTLVVGGFIDTKNVAVGTLQSAIAGGTASVLGGGKFINGAQTGAFGYLFNCVTHKCWKLPNNPEAAYYRYGTPGDGVGQYAQASTLSVIFEIEAAWGQVDPRRIGVGNISLENGGPFPPHGTHQQGLEFDIRPLRTDGAEAPIAWRDAAYDRAATQRLVDTLRASGQVDRILFNDPNIKGVTPYKGHDNHLHVKLKSPG